MLSDYAIVVNANDNVAVVKKTTIPGLEIDLPNGVLLELRDAVPPGHRFATRDIPAGEFVLQLGHPIGTSLGINSGEQITHANMCNDVPIVRELPEDLHTSPPDYLPLDQRATFRGYRRRDSRVVAIPHNKGCGCEDGLTIDVMRRTLSNYADHPNVGGVILIDLGCEKTKFKSWAEQTVSL